ncbi:uncharacterized protein METZ01_LOCUS38845 [marine metagenome]|uniref:Uncharacterized protein n=1 Tax=marine metagenome TaxID=408172 RepID=A0A381R2N6_9ZZZZ
MYFFEKYFICLNQIVELPPAPCTKVIHSLLLELSETYLV